MKIYTYCIIDSDERIDESIKGLEGARTYNIPFRNIGIVASDLNAPVQDINQACALEHEEVVERLMDKFTVLPVRFLTIFNKKEDVLSIMKDYYSDFRENLDRLRNKVEFGIKVIWHGDTIKERIVRERIINAIKKANLGVFVSDDSQGKSFIEEKFEKYKIDKEFEEEADRYITVVDNFFSRFAVEKNLEKLKSGNLLLNASYLVEKEKQSDFKEAFKHFKNVLGDLKYLFSGPWPPYNFIVLTRRICLGENPYAKTWQVRM